MALTIHILYQGEKGNARAFAKEMMSSGLVAEIRKEKGNLRYEYFYPLENEEAVLLIDSWESQEALDRHHALPLMGEIAALREKYDLHMVVELFQNLESLNDEKFIRK